jgi:hypothetical protein
MLLTGCLSSGDVVTRPAVTDRIPLREAIGDPDTTTPVMGSMSTYDEDSRPATRMLAVGRGDDVEPTTPLPSKARRALLSVLPRAATDC